MKTIKELVNQYKVSKTLRFELIPMGKTLEHMERKGFITQDEQRAEDYKEIKGVIDRYHKVFIEMCLRSASLDLEDLERYVVLAGKKDEESQKSFEEAKASLRRQVVEAFKNGATYGDLFKKELITQHLPVFVMDEHEKKIVDGFSKFTSYFTGFHENRRNMYTEEEKSTAIAYRLINDNLPKFVDNMKSFAKIASSPVSEHFVDIEKQFAEYLNVEHVGEMFVLPYYSKVLTQTQIAVYNHIIGGYTLEDGTKLKGINEYVNLFNQQHRDQRLPLLKPLYKMILSDRISLSWLPEKFESDAEMQKAITEAYSELQEVLSDDREGSLKYLLTHLSDYDRSGIFIANDAGLTEISQHLFGRYDVFTTAVKEDLRRTITPTPKEKKDPNLLDERLERLFKGAKSFSLAYLDGLTGESGGIDSYFSQLGAYDRSGAQGISLLTQIEMAYIAAEDVLNREGGNISQSDADTALIKDLLDAFKALQWFIKPLLGSGDEPDKDNMFDACLRGVWERLGIISPLYNKVRNWLTRKPYSTEKIKLNFENAQLLGGWDLNKEPDCTSVLLRKDGQYFLAIMDKKSNHAFDIDTLPSAGDCYEKMDYKLLPGANKMLPKVFFSKSRIKEFAPSDAVISAYQRGTHKKGKDFSLSDCHRLIDFFKASIAKHEDWRRFPFHFSPTETYEDISGFYREVEEQGYLIDFRRVSVDFVNQLVDAGKLYLFQIWNKDFSEHSKGTPNLHTLYWRMLFDERNLADVVYKLNGQAEVFYRKRSLDLEKTTVHRAGQTIGNKNEQNDKRESLFAYDIVKDRRYTVDKFQFHVPITMAFKANGSGNVNAQVMDIIRQEGVRHIIGIDRGERHLLYLSLIDLKGNIVKQMSLNEIVNEYRGNTYPNDYQQLLAQREGDRTMARRNWKRIENIKELKEGYLSQVVHIISKMMVEYDAVLVLEDLNMGFMRGRQKIERNVYEQFEKTLIDKLNYYVDKQREATEVGGMLKALQLTSKFQSFKKLGKQCGCIFYIPAWNTSKIDPVTGFVNMLDTRYENVDKTRLFFSRFDAIRYNAEMDWFEFAFDYSQFTAKADGTRTRWTLCSYGTRIQTFRNPAKNNMWDNEEILLTDDFKKAFAEAGIDIHGNLKDAICRLTEKQHLERLMHLMKLLLQMRNSVTNSEVDYLLSPVADEQGCFYDSRTCSDALPKDADANGAYNIARKGLWAIRQIQAAGKDGYVNLAISNREWLAFVQDKAYLD